MRDAKSWSMPAADESCPDRCGYLEERYRNMGTEEERRGLAFGMIEAMDKKKQADHAAAALFLGSLGLDPRDYLEDES